MALSREWTSLSCRGCARRILWDCTAWSRRDNTPILRSIGQARNLRGVTRRTWIKNWMLPYMLWQLDSVFINNMSNTVNLSHYEKGSCTFHTSTPEVWRLEKLQNLSNTYLRVVFGTVVLVYPLLFLAPLPHACATMPPDCTDASGRVARGVLVHVG
jgi:hypothetical protein